MDIYIKLALLVLIFNAYFDSSYGIEVCVVWDMRTEQLVEHKCSDDKPYCCQILYGTSCCSVINYTILHILATTISIFWLPFLMFSASSLWQKLDMTDIIVDLWSGQFIDSSNVNPIIQQSEALYMFNIIHYDPVKASADSIKKYESFKYVGTDGYQITKIATTTSGERYFVRILERNTVNKYQLGSMLRGKRNLLLSVRHWLFPLTKSVFDEEGSFYIVQEYLRGTMLTKLLAFNRGGLPEGIAKFLSAQVVIAIEYLHMANVLIRDIHPDAIIVQADGYVKICNLVRAEALDVDTFISRDKRGRIYYMPQEFLRYELWSKESDWWCFGVFVYHITTGVKPFESARGIRSTLAQINSNAFTFPWSCSRRFRQLIDGLLHTVPDKRFGASEVTCHRWFLPLRFRQIASKSINPPSSLMYMLNTVKHNKALVP